MIRFLHCHTGNVRLGMTRFWVCGCLPVLLLLILMGESRRMYVRVSCPEWY